MALDSRLRGNDSLSGVSTYEPLPSSQKQPPGSLAENDEDGEQ
jgi:hypothetical protein